MIDVRSGCASLRKRTRSRLQQNVTAPRPPISPHATPDPTKERQQDVAAAVIMGVSGAGKSTVGNALARRLDWAFVDGDSLHPPANVAKMHAGQALADRDRKPWLAAIATQIDVWLGRGNPGVIACSVFELLTSWPFCRIHMRTLP